MAVPPAWGTIYRGGRGAAIAVDSRGSVPTVYIETYGCQMNVADTELILGSLAAHGYARVAEPDAADVILLNTCAIREHAEERVLGRLGELAPIKSRAPGGPDRRHRLHGAASPRRACASARRTSTCWSAPTAIASCRRCSPATMRIRTRHSVSIPTRPTPTFRSPARAACARG